MKYPNGPGSKYPRAEIMNAMVLLVEAHPAGPVTIQAKQLDAIVEFAQDAELRLRDFEELT